MPQTHYMRLDDIPFKVTESGAKRLEVRLNDAKRQIININDIIIFSNASGQQTIQTRVTAIRRYATVDDLIRTEDFKATGGIYSSRVHWKDSINSYYSSEEQLKYGILILEIKKL